MSKPVRSPLACIVVHYGFAELTVSCIVSLQAGSFVPSIIVVSNTDDAGTQTLCECLHEHGVHADFANESCIRAAEARVFILPLGSNKGFAAACNAGLRLVRNDPTTRFVWLLNNDATVAADAAKCLLSCLENHPRALCGTSVFRADAPEKLELAFGCRFSSLTTIITPCHAGVLPHSIYHTPSVDYIYGASFAFPMTLVEDIGGFDESFFLYYEEHDYCLRARKAGYAFHWCRDARVWHGFVSPSAASVPSSVLRAFKHFHETRSTLIYMRKHHALLLLPAMLFRTIAKVFILWRRGQVWLLASYFRGLWAGLSCDKK